MSDGPHRSLPMRPWWRRLAERADRCAFGVEEVADALVPALEQPADASLVAPSRRTRRQVRVRCRGSSGCPGAGTRAGAWRADVSAVARNLLDPECLHELAPTFLRRLRRLSVEPGLFGPAESPQLEQLRAQTQSGLERRVLDNAALSPTEAPHRNFVARAIENAIQGHAPRFLRQIEEHYRRQSSTSRAQRVRDRLNEALGRADVSAVARNLLDPDGSRSVSRVPLKTGLDEGVRLR